MNELETPREYRLRRLWHKSGRCPLCPLNGCENAKRHVKHGTQKPRYKNHRRHL